MKYFIMSTFTILVFFFSCKEEDPGGNNHGQPLVYDSLWTENDTISPGETTKIIATASGYNLTYHWTASAGDILNSGSEVIYTSPPCNIGANQVTCKVVDGNNNSKSKSITIVVE